MQLVDQYSKIFLKSQLSNLDFLSDRKNIMDRIMKRVTYEAFMQEQVHKQQREADDEKLAFATIDWHDFIVVESIEFTTADDQVALPPPMSIMELESMTLEQRKSLVNFEEKKDGHAEVDMDIDMDIMDDMITDHLPPPPPPKEISKPPPPPPTSMPVRETVITNIRESYVPKRILFLT
jgi:splicing factor 3A subunit 1